MMMIGLITISVHVRLTWNERRTFGRNRMVAHTHGKFNLSFMIRKREGKRHHPRVTRKRKVVLIPRLHR